MSEWFLTAEERGNVSTDIDRDGSWVEVRGLLWRSHSDHLAFNAQENQRLGTELNEAGGEVLLDQRVRRLASHHQKLFVIRHRGAAAKDVAYVGGIGLSHQRRDSAEHLGDPQQAPMDRRYGERAPWHDAALELRVVDDEWFTCGSDNFNRRSWTNDSELTCAVVGDGLAAEVRSELWREHLGAEPELDPVKGFSQWSETAAALDAWHLGIGPPSWTDPPPRA